MAELVALRAAFVRLGFTPQAAIALVDEQGLDSLDEIKRLDDNGVSELCKTIRCPGGTIANDAGAQVANPGIAVSHKSLKNMQLLSFWLKHMERISRPATSADITPEAVESLRQLREREKNFVKPTDKPKINHKDWFKTMEAIKEYLAQCPGLTKIPLAYVVRDDVEVPAHASDPQTAYTSHQHEMIRRAPHGTDTFKEDRELVFIMLRDICENDPAYVYMKPAVEPRNGRMAYRLLYDHYLGQSAVDQLITKAETKLNTLAYTGKDTRRWTFETFVSQHKEQHALIDTLKTRGLYLGIDDASKVRYLLAGLKDPRLEAAKSQILTSSDLRNNFDSAVRLCQDTLTLQGTQRAQLNVSSTGVQPAEGVEDRYYGKEEYSTLSAKQKDALKALRKKRKKGDGKKKSGSDGKGKGGSAPAAKRLKKSMAKLPKQIISALETQLKKAVSERLESGTLDDSSSDDESVVPMKDPAPDNANHPALTRQKKKKK